MIWTFSGSVAVVGAAAVEPVAAREPAAVVSVGRLLPLIDLAEEAAADPTSALARVVLAWAPGVGEVTELEAVDSMVRAAWAGIDPAADWIAQVPETVGSIVLVASAAVDLVADWIVQVPEVVH